jgi:hypothetical protein
LLVDVIAGGCDCFDVIAGGLLVELGVTLVR